ncbi:MAG: LuxR C-terminal-related transcriptional regulator [Nitrospiraceae bacterium]
MVKNIKAHEQPTKTLIVSNNQMICAGIRMILDTHPHIVVIGEVSLARKALEIADRECPQVVLIDLDLSGVDVVRLIRDLRKSAEQSLVLLLSSLGDGDLTRKALCSGAAGVVLKVQPPAVLIAAIESLCAVEPQSDHGKIRSAPFLLASHSHAKPPEQEMQRINALTRRERDIISLIGKGLKNRGIADHLCISETTVRHHLTNIFSKLEVSDRQQLLIWAHRYHLVELTQSSDTA